VETEAARKGRARGLSARRELNRVHMSPKRACQHGWRGASSAVYLACIHMQIPIDMTTFTYCIFALGHILARQFPIVGFRPPVRLIDIIGRAADTRLHFYLHTFADQFARSPACHPFSPLPLLSFAYRHFSLPPPLPSPSPPSSPPRPALPPRRLVNDWVVLARRGVRERVAV